MPDHAPDAHVASYRGGHQNIVMGGDGTGAGPEREDTENAEEEGGGTRKGNGKKRHPAATSSRLASLSRQARRST